MTERLLQLLKRGTSAVMVVKEAEEQLKEAGFEELHFSNTWGLTEGGKYYMKHHDTTLLAFTVAAHTAFKEGFRIAAAHTDFPCLRIKPNPDVVTNGYAQVNVEVYGGAILNTWLDRPLSISGRMAVKSDDVMHPKMHYISIEKPLMTIPNLAIHMNREVNKGVELNKQTDMLPIAGLLEEEFNEKHAFLNFLAKEEGVKAEDILDYELWVYCMQEPVTLGMKEEFLLSPRLDNLTSVQALLTGLIEGKQKHGINVIALFDHEEIGSRTKQGTGSMLLLDVLEKICDSFGKTIAQTKECLYESFLLSVDVAHGLHPNKVGKMDITNKPVLGRGLCIKEASSQSYATDCEAIAIVEQICQKAGVSYQKFVNRSDMPGGGTLGSIASSILPIRTVDVGVPLLAMHSAVETMGRKDMESLTGLVKEYFSI